MSIAQTIGPITMWKPDHTKQAHLVTFPAGTFQPIRALRVTVKAFYEGAPSEVVHTHTIRGRSSTEFTDRMEFDYTPRPGFYGYSSTWEYID